MREHDCVQCSVGFPFEGMGFDENLCRLGIMGLQQVVGGTELD